jgi:hypothetical protein
MCFEEDKMHGENRRVMPNYQKGDVAICFVRKLHRARDLLPRFNCAIQQIIISTNSTTKKIAVQTDK